MGFLKKIWKEISVFGLVFVIFIALFAYRQATHVELTTISKTKLVENNLHMSNSFNIRLRKFEL